MSQCLRLACRQFDRHFRRSAESDSMRLMKAMEVAHTYQVLILLQGLLYGSRAPDEQKCISIHRHSAMARGSSDVADRSDHRSDGAGLGKPGVGKLMGAVYPLVWPCEMAEESMASMVSPQAISPPI